MVQSQFSLSWDSHKSSICNGFSALQQNGEFVDMTLAADGHLVKVHQVLMALASPYLKELITSAPCQHPIIFLNNVSHKCLGLILEYIYSGEVLVPAESLASFTETAKALHIRGLDNMMNPEAKTRIGGDTSKLEEDLCNVVTGMTRAQSSSGSALTSASYPPAVKLTLHQNSSAIGSSNSNLPSFSIQAHDQNEDFSMIDLDETGAQNDDYCINNLQPTTSKEDSCITAAPNFQFTVSIRGSLQVILNRYIYNLHSVKHRSGVRRWRCVNYRNSKCLAFIVTKDNVVLNRANLHNHAFHDKKILQKIEQKSVFSTLDDLEGFKEKEFKKGKNVSDEEQILYEN